MLKQFEVKNIYIGEYKPNFATQGPCPDGFHVPLSSELDSIKTIWIALGGGSSDGAGFSTAFKMPYSGWRSRISGDITSQGSYGSYRSCSYDSGDGGKILYIGTSSINNTMGRCSQGYSIRPFKNSPVTPTSSWTKLYGTSIESGGIFWDSSSGLISLSSDGSTWITMSDKNLGATTVYNNGDTLSESNCGKYYQWGNNYGFAWTGSISTSGTKVNASNYGPGNYYSSSTFIYSNSGAPNNWSTVQNDNLRGGVTGNVPVS